MLATARACRAATAAAASCGPTSCSTARAAATSGLLGSARWRISAAADLLVIGGTSLVVYPAAGLVRYFGGEKVVVVNRDPTPADATADLVCACDIAKAFDF